MSSTKLQNDSPGAVKARLLLMHGLCLAAVFFPVNQNLLLLGLISYCLRTFGVEGAYHRYFSHRSFSTSRWFQFILAILATSSGQRGVLSWAGLHRKHHKHSDTEQDPHSPVVNSFWFAHLTWIWDDRHRNPTLDNVRDLTRYPELVWINRYHYLVTSGTVIALFLIGANTDWLGADVGGMQAVLWGFMIPTMLVFHMTMSINSVLHYPRFGNRRFNTGDASRNVAWLALPSMGSAWHNNHHHHPGVARAGFYWWEVDLVYLMIRLLGAIGLVWGIREVPRSVLKETESQSSQVPIPSETV